MRILQFTSKLLKYLILLIFYKIPSSIWNARSNTIHSSATTMATRITPQDHKLPRRRIVARTTILLFSIGITAVMIRIACVQHQTTGNINFALRLVQRI